MGFFKRRSDGIGFGAKWVVDIDSKNPMEKEISSGNRIKAAIEFYIEAPISYFMMVILALALIYCVVSYFNRDQNEVGFGLLRTLLPQAMSAIFAFVGLVVMKFWQLYNQFGSKWQFAAKTYYDIRMKELIDHASPDLTAAKADLAIDILAMGIWSDRALAKFFFDMMHEAYILENLGDQFLGAHGFHKGAHQSFYKYDGIKDKDLVKLPISKEDAYNKLAKLSTKSSNKLSLVV
ncbi:MAG: hypothetical protein EOP06_03250 [Proteobacteria bacterium]|nr:MAG: hypothetical protein EOP06_03250 [Pseudomonadota bacterium]